MDITPNEPRILWDLDTGAHYEWDTIALVERDGVYAIYSDSGCSCNYAYEANWSADLSWSPDITALARQLRQEIRDRAADRYSSLSDGMAAEERAKLARAVSNERRRAARRTERGA